MDYKLSAKNKEGKWWTYGSIKKNQWGNNQASFKVSSLEDLIAQAKAEGKEWVNLSLFENDKEKIDSHNEAKGNAYQPQDVIDDLNDSIPF